MCRQYIICMHFKWRLCSPVHTSSTECNLCGSLKGILHLFQMLSYTIEKYLKKQKNESVPFSISTHKLKMRFKLQYFRKHSFHASSRHPSYLSPISDSIFKLPLIQCCCFGGLKQCPSIGKFTNGIMMINHTKMN
jgi:hypothetical protein